MVKRKADHSSQNDDGSPAVTRRLTRSSGLLSHAQLPLSPVKKQRKALPVVATPSDGNSGSSKGNDTRDANHTTLETSDSDIDLLCTPSRKADAAPVSSTRLTHANLKQSPRQIMDAVVISTPKSTSRTPHNFFRRVEGSPSPSRARNIGKAMPIRLSKNNHQGITLHSPRNPNVATLSSSPSPSREHIAPKSIMSSPFRPVATKQLPRPLPSHLVPHLHSQKKAVLRALQHPPLNEHESSPHASMFNQLTELTKGTTQRNEGNSCLILGPRGSGKSRLLDSVLASIVSTSTQSPIIVQLSAHCQTNDRSAMREIARQIQQQMGSSLLPAGEDEEDSAEVDTTAVGMNLPPSSRLPGMIAALPRLGRPVIVVLDGFDGFAAHSRQALLYCLLDTVQSCRGGSTSVDTTHQPVHVSTDTTEQQDMASDSSVYQEYRASDGDSDGDDKLEAAKAEHGLLVIGVTSRVDCLTLLEKRVKSRFSHRIMRIGTPSCLDDVFELIKTLFHVDVDMESATTQEWKQLWTASVENFLADMEVLNALKEAFALSKDLRIFLRLLISPVAALTPHSPWLSASQFICSASTQRSSTRFPFLTALPYPHIALLIAAAHEQTAGHETFNFEMLYDKFITQVRVSVSAPVQMERGGLGMVNVARAVMLGAFEQLVTNRVFQPVAAPSTHITKEFVKYRCVATRGDLKGAVEYLGQTNLKKWFSRNQ